MKRNLHLLLSLSLATGIIQTISAGTLTVTNLNDNGTGSLRWAIGAASSGDTINFSVTGTIVFDTSITWNKRLTIVGPGVADLVLDGDDSTKIFIITGGKTIIRNIAFKHGYARVGVGGTGGCIHAPSGSGDTVIVENCTFSKSKAFDAGGAIATVNGRYLVMRNCSIDSCVSISNLGGGIMAYSGAILENSTFSNCSAPYLAGCAWIVNNVSTITNCTFINNKCTTYAGGAIVFENHSTVLLMNNTFSGNFASTLGDAIYANHGIGLGGPTITLQNNIFDSPSGNYGQSSAITSIHVSNGGNIYNDNTMISFLNAPNDLNNTDPLLDPAGLQNNGGTTMTIALTSSSPAINNGISSWSPLLDQRGFGRIGHPDAGAFEFGVVTISGAILTETGVPVPGVKVVMTGFRTDSMVTPANGLYSFDVPGGNYTVTPSKNNDVVVNNGITALDVLLIQKHLLSIAPLGSPYKLIAAAEANAKGNTQVSALDLLFTRQVILGQITSFPGNRLWQFVSSDYVFPDATNPFPFPNTRTYTNITTNQSGQDFIGIKLGDVNGSWDRNTP